MVYKSYRGNIDRAFGDEIEKTLEAIGSVVVSANKALSPVSPIDGGNYRASHSHEIVPSEKKVIIGNGAKYAPYLEYGTGIHAENGDGRQTPWIYFDDKTGEYVFTRGMKPQKVMRNGLKNSEGAINAIIRKFNP